MMFSINGFLSRKKSAATTRVKSAIAAWVPPKGVDANRVNLVVMLYVVSVLIVALLSSNLTRGTGSLAIWLLGWLAVTDLARKSVVPILYNAAADHLAWLSWRHLTFDEEGKAGREPGGAPATAKEQSPMQAPEARPETPAKDHEISDLVRLWKACEPTDQTVERAIRLLDAMARIEGQKDPLLKAWSAYPEATRPLVALPTLRAYCDAAEAVRCAA